MITRYKKSVEPVHTDGRDIDPDVAVLSGEASNQDSSGSSDKHIKGVAQVWEKPPTVAREDPTYYERPLLNEPVWKWVIPFYYYVGGLSGASLVLAAAVQACGSNHAQALVRRCRWTGFLGTCASGALLVFDLGKPARFLNMLRVFRPTSPMNVGAWILSGAGGTAMMAVLPQNSGGSLAMTSETCGLAAGVFGMGLATYTGVLLANTAVPLWQASRRVLPVLFGASAMASAGAASAMLAENSEELRIARAFGVAGQFAELAAGAVMELQASTVPRVGRPLQQGLSGAMWRTATALTVTSAVIALLPKQSRGMRIASGVLGTLGSLVLRFAVAHAGVTSARDARASFQQQRAGHGAAEVVPSA